MPSQTITHQTIKQYHCIVIAGYRSNIFPIVSHFAPNYIIASPSLLTAKFHYCHLCSSFQYFPSVSHFAPNYIIASPSPITAKFHYCHPCSSFQYFPSVSYPALKYIIASPSLLTAKFHYTIALPSLLIVS
jgi:hypothetical protein